MIFHSTCMLTLLLYCTVLCWQHGDSAVAVVQWTAAAEICHAGAVAPGVALAASAGAVDVAACAALTHESC